MNRDFQPTFVPPRESATGEGGRTNRECDQRHGNEEADSKGWPPSPDPSRPLEIYYSKSDKRSRRKPCKDPENDHGNQVLSVADLVKVNLGSESEEKDGAYRIRQNLRSGIVTHAHSSPSWVRTGRSPDQLHASRSNRRKFP
ncbi:hypothetical protein N9B73_00900 [Verrucomicrobiales bacterium]|jgi:hypothetical protein|nr:hypothetical protein [Verrucomicrobiales bacterium]